MTTTVTVWTELTSRRPAAAAEQRKGGSSTATTTPLSPPAGSMTASATVARALTSTGAGLSSVEWIRAGRNSSGYTSRPVRIIADTVSG
jgi:hypothetical protein